MSSAMRAENAGWVHAVGPAVAHVAEGDKVILHPNLMAIAARGAVTPHTRKYALDDFQSAGGDLDAGRVRGRAILTP